KRYTMKILYITTISNTVNAFLIPHIEMLINKGFSVDIACQITKEIDPKLTKLGCKVYDIPFQRNPLSFKNYRAYKNIKKILNTEDYDLIHTHTPVASTISRLVSKSFPDIKVFYTAHGFHFFKGAPLKNWLIFYPIEKYLSKFTDTLITINQEDYEIAKKKFYANEVFYIPGVGIDLDKFNSANEKIKYELRNKKGFKKNDFILIQVGELNANKNQRMLIEAIELIKDDIPNVKVLLVGKGPLNEEYELLIKNRNLDDIIELLGYRKDINELMTLSDLAISTSKREGLPVNVLEAMATGLPIIVTDVRGNRDLVKDNKNGYIIPIDDTQKLSEKIKKIYQSEELIDKISKDNLENIKSYSLKKVFINKYKY